MTQPRHLLLVVHLIDLLVVEHQEVELTIEQVVVLVFLHLATVVKVEITCLLVKQETLSVVVVEAVQVVEAMVALVAL
jgi:hypothetical protein